MWISLHSPKLPLQPDFASKASLISTIISSARRMISSQNTSHPPDELSQKNLRALQTLLHPESMGTQFHYLALSKGVALAALSGFKFARDAGKQLFAEVH